jgi:hypothetical protein
MTQQRFSFRQGRTIPPAWRGHFSSADLLRPAAGASRPRAGCPKAWSIAPDGGPLASALAARTRPISRTVTIGQPTATIRPLTATDDDHADRSAAAYSTVEAIAWIGIGLHDTAARDARWIPIGAVARALQGHDRHTPQAVKVGALLTRSGSSIRRLAGARTMKAANEREKIRRKKWFIHSLRVFDLACHFNLLRLRA